MKTKFKTSSKKNSESKIKILLKNNNFRNNQNYVINNNVKKNISKNLIYYSNMNNKQKLESKVILNTYKGITSLNNIKKIKISFVKDISLFIFGINFIYFYFLIETLIKFNLLIWLYINIIMFIFSIFYLKSLNKIKFIIYKDTKFIYYFKKD